MSGRLRGGIWVAHGGAQAGARRGLRLVVCAVAVSFVLLACCSQALAAGRTTSVTIGCAPAMIAGHATTCTATVTDEGAVPRPTPTGTVMFSRSGSQGTFSPPNPCELKAIGEEGKASCSVQYTPANAGSVKITAVYAGDKVDAGSEAANEAPVSSRSTHVTVSCVPPMLAGKETTCTATVTDEETAPRSTPTGMVTFKSLQGTFSLPNPCKLVAGGEGEASCSVNYTPANAGSVNITAVYPEDEVHAGSEVTQPLTVAARTTQVIVSCGPGVVVGQTASCSATVKDTSSEGTTSIPVGNVTFGSDLEGPFSPEATCPLKGTEQGTASCTVEYTPAKAGTATITATYPGDGAHAEEKDSAGLTVTAPAPAGPPPQVGTTTTPPPTTPVTTPRPTLPRPPVPICRVSVSELVRTIGRRGHRHKVPALSVTYTCDQTATVRITGVVTIAGRARAGKKTRATNVPLSGAKAPATAGKASAPLFLALPPTAVKALNAGRRTTTALSLTVQNANGRSLGTLRLTLVAQSALRRK